MAIVTGAWSGIGLGVARALLKRGYRVVGSSRTMSQSKELKASGELVLVDGDIGKKERAVRVAEFDYSLGPHRYSIVNGAGSTCRSRLSIHTGGL